MSRIISAVIGGNVVKIGQGAFSGSDIRTLTLPDSLSGIEENAFLNCQNLEKISYNGTENARETNLTIDETGNETLLNAAWYYTDSDGNLDAYIYKFRVSIDGTMYAMDELMSVIIRRGLFDSFGIGNAYSAQIEIQFIPKTDVDEISVMGEIIPYASADSEEADDFWVQLGRFYIDERSVESGIATLIAYDAMLKSGYLYDTIWEVS